MKHRIEQIPIYHGKIGLVVTDNAQDLKSLFSIQCLNDAEILTRKHLYAHTMWLDHKGHVCFTILLNFNSSAGKITHGVIAHEALHATNMLFQSRGVEHTYNHDEHLTYMIDWIVTFVYKTLNKWNMLNQISINL